MSVHYGIFPNNKSHCSSQWRYCNQACSDSAEGWFRRSRFRALTVLFRKTPNLGSQKRSQRPEHVSARVSEVGPGSVTADCCRRSPKVLL